MILQTFGLLVGNLVLPAFIFFMQSTLLGSTGPYIFFVTDKKYLIFFWALYERLLLQKFCPLTVADTLVAIFPREIIGSTDCSLKYQILMKKNVLYVI